MLCDLIYGNFDGMPNWAELGADNVNSNYFDLLLKSGFVEESNDLNYQFSYFEDVIYVDDSTPHKVFKQFVDKIKNSIENN